MYTAMVATPFYVKGVACNILNRDCLLSTLSNHKLPQNGHIYSIHITVYSPTKMCLLVSMVE